MKLSFVPYFTTMRFSILAYGILVIGKEQETLQSAQSQTETISASISGFIHPLQTLF
jgi:hypothetical protein